MSNEPIRGSAEWIKAEQARVASGTAKSGGSSFPKWIGIGCGIPAALVIIFILISTLSVRESTAPDAPSRYTQTWDKNYSETTCDDWNGPMTSAQQFAAAADILTAARNKIDGASGLPPDSLIDDFQAGVGNVCVIPTMSLTDVTYGLYTTEPRFQP